MQNEYDFLRRLYMDDSATKFGYAFYLSYFFRNVLDFRKRFDRITLKKLAKPYTVSDFCMGVCIAISVGCCPFSRIDTELYEERKLACSVGFSVFEDLRGFGNPAGLLPENLCLGTLYRHKKNWLSGNSYYSSYSVKTMRYHFFPIFCIAY